MTVPDIQSTATTLTDVEVALVERLVTPDHHKYDSSRTVWNGLVNKRPSFIAHVETVDEVQLAVKFARDAGIPLAVRA
jgi:FAD/FMN-containing dehydrogenase